MRWCLVSLLVLCIALLGAGAQAHPAAVSKIEIDIGQQYLRVSQELDAPTLTDVLPVVDPNDDGRFEVAEFELTKDHILTYLDGKLTLASDGQRCKPDAPSRFELRPPKQLFITRDYKCESPLGKLRIDNDVFMEDRGGHRHVGIFRLGDVNQSFTFIADAPSYELDASKAPPKPGGKVATKKTAKTTPKPEQEIGLLGWVKEGVKHILIGTDHILFVIALVTVVRSFRELAIVITSFTVAHSITLALATLGVVKVSPVFVETLIAISIAYVAFENILREKIKHRQAVTFGFGLMHGFGFASVLGELGLPESDLVWPLLGFNVGVEVGQLAIVAPVFPLLRYLQRDATRYRKVLITINGAVGILACLWAVDRASGLGFMPF